MLLRDYAFVEKIGKKQSHSVKLNFACLAASGTVFVLGFTALNAVSVLLRDYIPAALNPLSSSKPVALIELGLIMAAASIWVDRTAKPFSTSRPQIVDDFHARAEMTNWWLVTLSILPAMVVNALLLMKFFGED